MKFKKGDKVALKFDEVPYYSGYAGNPHVVIPAGSVGVLAEVDCPYVTRNPGVFQCVDFDLPGVFNGGPQHQNTTWRVGVAANRLKNAPA